MKDRQVKLTRGCLERGYISMENMFTHCGNEKCASCNQVRAAWNEALTDWTTGKFTYDKDK